MLRFAWYALLAATPAMLLIPFQTDLMKTAGWLHGYLAIVAVQIYEFVKVAVLWLVPGMLFSLLMPRLVIQGWAVVAAAGCFLAGWAIVPAMNWGEAKEILFALPGLAIGLWLGEGFLARDGSGGIEAASSDVVSARMASQTQGDRVPVMSLPDLGGRVLGTVLLGLVAMGLYDFPLAQIALGLGLAAYAIALWRWPGAWLIFVPAALPLLDLAPWTGRFFWDEFDLLLLVTVAVALWQGRLRLESFAVPKLTPVLVLFLLCFGVSLVLGLLPLQPIDANAFSAYWSHYNSLRLAKGLLWGLAFFGLYRGQKEPASAFTWLSIGLALGVLGVSVLALREHLLFAGAANTTDYRVTAGFSSMHTGGGHFEAYLVMALPFVWRLVFSLRHPACRFAAAAVFLFGAYAMFLTVARGGLIALGLALVLLMLGTWLAHRGRRVNRSNIAMPLALCALTIVVTAAGISSEFWQQRLTQTATDVGVRFRHWAEVLSLRDPGLVPTLFGQGLGTLPAAHLVNRLPDEAGSYRYASDGGNRYLALNSTGTLYVAQRVARRPAEQLTLEVSVRAPETEAGLEIALCEKSLFNSLRCEWRKVSFRPGDARWQSVVQTFNTGDLGAGNLLTRRPVQFSLYNPASGTVVEVDQVRLLDESGRDLLQNGDFTDGADFWFFKSNDHLFWHAKNLWVHLLFEQGWLGALSFTLILLVALSRLAGATARGTPQAAVLLAATSAMVVIGGVDSLLDAPRLGLLVYGLLFLGASQVRSRG